MRRVLIVSDSHGNNDNVREAIKKAGKIDLMIHLGDVGRDYLEVERMSGVPTYIVAGNNDYGRGLRDMCIIYIGEHKCLLTHGHRQHVHFGVDRLRYLALENECDIAMYGHTHVPFLEEASEDVTILNPGSISLPRQIGHEKTFLIMEIDDEENITYTFDHI
ncbi:MAG: metallophosphoesterase [Lachnospiraceae bacterium]|nr:metallophosphoesterase [Lachnospiraceae bacterium]